MLTSSARAPAGRIGAPPAHAGAHHVGRGGVAQPGAQAARRRAGRRLDRDPILLADAQPARRVGVDQQHRIGRDLAGPRLAAEARMVIGLLAVAGEQDQRKPVAHVVSRALARRRREVGQRIEAGGAHGLGQQLDPGGRRRERLLLEIAEPIRHRHAAGALQLGERDAAVADDELVERALATPRDQVVRERTARREAVEQADRDVEIAARLAGRRHGIAGVEHRRTGRRERDFLLLERRGLGQHDVGHRGGRRHLVRRHRDEVEAAQRLQGALRVRIGDRDVDAADVHRPHRVRGRREDRVDNSWVVAGGLPAARPGPQREAVGAERLPLDLLGQAELRHVQEVEIRAKTTRRLDPAIAALPVDIAADRHQRVECAKGLHAGTERVDAVPADEAGRTLRVHARGSDDRLGRHAGQLRRDGGRIERRALRERVEAVAPALDEGAVVEFFLDQHRDHRQRERRVGAGTRTQPQVGEIARRNALRVDHDQARAALLGLLDGGPLDGVRRMRIAPDQQNAVGVRDVLARRDVEAHGARAHRAAAAAQVLVDHPVGAADRAHEQRHDGAAAEEGAAHRADDGARAMPRAHRRQPLRHLVERRVPGDARPAPAAARPVAPQRMQHAAGAVGDAERAAHALDAERALRIGMRRVGHDVGDATALDGDERAAAHRAFPAGAGMDLGAGRCFARLRIGQRHTSHDTRRSSRATPACPVPRIRP